MPNIIGTVIAAGLVTPAVLQYQANTRLKGDIEALRRQLAARAQPQPAEPRLTDADELERLRREHAELVRLRGEVTTFRQRLAAVPKGQSEPNDIDRIKALQKSGEDAQGQALLAKSPDIPMIPAKSWENSGFTTPVSALETLNWAVRNHDTNAFATALSWDAQAKARAEALFAALPQSVQDKYGSVDGVIFDWMLNHGTPMAAYSAFACSTFSCQNRSASRW